MTVATKKVLIKTLRLLVIFYVAICILLFFFQEKLIFLPGKLEKNYRFSFNQNFEEINIQTGKDKFLHGLLFKADSAKGLIFYLHGNAGSLKNWGEVASLYTDLHYNVFILDYPGYGKSDGSINGEQELIDAIQIAYNHIKKDFPEEKIIVLGYSIGTGPAAIIASSNNPKLLILQAPYFSLTDMMKHYYPIIPTFLLKYKFRTNEHLKKCKMPVVIFHGDTDDVIYYGSSMQLKESFKPNDTLITLKGQGHNGMTDNPEYINAMKQILK